MAKRRPRKPKVEPKITPPLGPAQNLRPAGAHESKKHYDRKRDKTEIERTADTDDDSSL